MFGVQHKPFQFQDHLQVCSQQHNADVQARVRVRVRGGCPPRDRALIWVARPRVVCRLVWWLKTGDDSSIDGVGTSAAAQDGDAWKALFENE